MTRNGLKSWFSQDDLLNLYYCWSHTVHDLLAGYVLFFRNYNRPTGESLYRIIYAGFGFNPQPFNIVRLVLCSLNLVTLYAFVSRISRSREAGAIALLLGGFHPACASLYFDTGMIFDVLAFLFYYSAFLVYLNSRRAGRYPGAASSAGILLLYILALDSKEIAVSFPVALLLYELTAGLGNLRMPARKFGMCAVTGLITLPFIIGRNAGPGALMKQSAYHPVASLTGYLATYSQYIAEFVFVAPQSIRPLMGWILAGCIAVSVLLRNRVLLWASLFNVFAVLPIAFIPARAAFAFTVPLAGWLVYLGVLIPLLRAKLISGNAMLRLPSQTLVAGAIVLLVLRPESAVMRDIVRPVIHADQDLTRDAFDSLRAVLPLDLKGKRVLALHDPLRNGYGLSFLLHLSYNERDLTVDTTRSLAAEQMPLLPASYDLVVDYIGGEFVAVRPH